MFLLSASNTSSPCCDFLLRSKQFFISIDVRVAPKYRNKSRVIVENVRWAPYGAQACANGRSGNPLNNATKSIVLKRLSEDEEDYDYKRLADRSGNCSGSSSSNIRSCSYYSSTNFREEDPIVDKLRTQLGVIHPIPSPPPVNRNVVGLFAFFFVVGVVFDKLWAVRKRNEGRGKGGQVPNRLSSFLENDFQRKESVEWVNMVLGKFWRVYRGGIENWIIGLLQPVIDNLKKPDYVERVEIKQFSLGDEPLSVRSVDRRTSRRDNDLQYQIGLRYTGGAWMLLLLSLKFGILPIVVPVGVRDFDIDGELWVKLRLIPTEPWVGAASWAFVSLPKIKFELSPFRLFNLMGKTDPYVILKLGDQVIRSKRNSQTTVIGPPGEPIWNQDFHLLVADPRKEKLFIEVKDSLGFADLPVGTASIDIGSLKDTVPAERIVVLGGGWSLFGNGSAGEVLLRLTYKAYVEDEDDERSGQVSTDTEPEASEDEMSNFDEQASENSFMDVLAALLVSEEFRGIVTSETVNANVSSLGAAVISNTTSESYAKAEQQTSANDSGSSRGSTLFWLAVVTSISVLVALNMGGFSLFNP